MDAHPAPKGQVIGTNAYLEFERVLKQELQPSSFPSTIQGFPRNTPSPHGIEVRAQYFPFLYCVVTPWSFVLPSSQTIEQKWSPRESPLGFACEPQDAADDSVYESHTQKSEVSRICNGLLGFASQAGIKLDTFSLGPAAHHVGEGAGSD